MLAAVVKRPGELVIEQVEKPVPGPRQFLIKTLAASICNATDNHILEGIFDGYHDRYPQILGHEVCGRVVEVGSEVTEVKPGDRIAMYTPYGAFAEYVPVDADGYGYAMVPENVPDEVASICEMFDGAFRSTIACAEVKKGEKILIVGAGPMGLTAAAAAVACGATVAVTDLYQNRLDKALEMGASFAYNRSEMSSEEILQALMRDLGPVDTACMCIALDRSRENDAFYLPVEALKENGRMTGLCVEVKLKDHNHWMNPFHLTRKNIKFRHNLERPGTVADFQRGYDMVGEGKIPMEKLITHRIDLDGLPWALDLCHNHPDQCIKVVVYPKRSEERKGEPV
ncbi:MAG TPA: alcohol dehydrogenase catalytic domain-containing protein [Candidatus Eisenbergiella merdigallinarum]|uniref:Alcohol dehydrogenase catalytic domain-containing protein n=1 Tax=Candidatus Eisenbergiella merdigallinarum TaxID=2838552 RepID=A0A9D2SEG2_9FIRM|nr:alcohol dehydrogenase catalytic domain-containing protein [Candidatus Eisenbergiella merdigallinarum]